MPSWAKGCGKLEPQAKRALARLLEAQADLQSARSLARTVQSRSLFHSQQCAEKALKACLSKVMVGEIKVHAVVKVLREKVLPHLSLPLQSEFSQLEEETFWLERRWIDTRYEEIGAEGEIITPVFRFQAADSRKGIEIAAKTLSWARRTVNYLFTLQLPKRYSKLKELAQKEFS